MLEQLRSTCRELLESGKVDVVIGYGTSPDGFVCPTFVTEADDVDQLVWNAACHANLVAYLKRQEIRKLGRPALVVKGCDARALVVLENESQIDRDDMVVIGVACEGVGEPRDAKCEVCDAHMPQDVDVTIGEVENPAVREAERYARLDELLAMTPEQRMEFWNEEFDRCFKCYACRQICPLCYCRQCIVDKNRPTVIDTSPTLKGNYAWHITRAFHLAGRCIGCGECARACPAGIDLHLLNLVMAKAAETHFDFRPGLERGAEPLIGTYSEQDKESFIG